MEKTKIVVLTGAGISAESGLKTFRDSDGLWEGYNVYDVASSQGWQKDPKMVLDFYNERRQNVFDAKPNNAHKLIAQLETKYDVTIITQNIDDLHERAGSTNIIHLHGEITKCRSVNDLNNFYPYNKDIKIGDLAKDGSQLRPHIVWFGEQVPMMDFAVEIVETSNIFIIVGTSLQVYPAASLTQYLNASCTNYIIDKSIPDLANIKFTKIEKKATEGMQILYDKLMK